MSKKKIGESAKHASDKPQELVKPTGSKVADPVEPVTPDDAMTVEPVPDDDAIKTTFGTPDYIKTIERLKALNATNYINVFGSADHIKAIESLKALSLPDYRKVYGSPEHIKAHKTFSTPEILNVASSLEKVVDNLKVQDQQKDSMRKELLAIKSKLESLKSRVETKATPIDNESDATPKNDADADADIDVDVDVEDTNETTESWQLKAIATKVNGKVIDQLCEDPKLLSCLTNEAEQPAFIVAVDIRKSTDLMLKATTPQKFAEFITELTEALKSVIKENFGVFDKFTGDGILAYFPECISGKDSAILAAKAAAECHRVFIDVYRENHSKFTAVPAETGLGIGIDYGNVCTVRINLELTVVGKPVVYACRLSGAKAGQTLVNQQALEELHKYQKSVKLTETRFEFKHEGVMLVHQLELSKDANDIKIDEPFQSIELG